MKTISKYIVASALATVMTAPAVAQNTNSGYFLDDYTYRYQMNPALGNDKNFVSMPALGDLNLAMRGNLHLSACCLTAMAAQYCSPTRW